MKKILGIIVMIVINQSVNAQNIFNLHDKKNSVYFRYGIEPTLVLSSGFMHTFQLKNSKRTISTFGELGSPTKFFGLKNYELKIGGVITVLNIEKFGMSYNLNFSTGHVTTKNFGSQKLSLGNKILAGYFKDKWYISFTGEYEKIYANKIKHSRYYRDYIYPEAKDGWYKGAGGNIQLGIETGATIKQKFDVIFEFKLPKSEKFNSYYGSPANVNLSVGYRF